MRKFIGRLESDLRRIVPETPFHAVIGRDFGGQVDQAASWLAGVYDDGAKEFDVTALFVEMVAFEINSDQWRLTGMTFKMPVGELLADLEDSLGEYEGVGADEFVLTGMEDLQAAFEQACEADLFTSEAPEDQQRLEAMGVAFGLITVRMAGLIAAAHREAGRRGHAVGRVHVFAKTYDSTMPPVCCFPSNWRD
ncbi:MAG: hypothetical protein ISS69_14530 [Phycisphaerae bacterium]|nr:hypothetical protein [Phycisphaerae bacterium]